MNHYRKTATLYTSRHNAEVCPFCKSETLAKAIYEDTHIYIVPNLTQYDLWELYDVRDHLLVVPKRHLESIKDMNTEERTSVINVLADYEVEGYSVYARGVGFVHRSVKHQHTHLIKTSSKKARLAIFMRRPYFLIKK